MLYQLLANLVLLVHLGFIVFVLGGGLLVMKWRRVAWVHLPAAAWGMIVELKGWICPLTPLENWLRAQADQTGYEGDFLAHYLLSGLYPAGLTQEIQIVSGIIVLVVNLTVYGCLWWRASRRTGRTR
jgi:hypothetical protein